MPTGPQRAAERQSKQTAGSIQFDPLSLRRIAFCTVFAIIAAFAFTETAAAQWRLGGFVGGEHESSWDEFLILGADARGVVGTRGLELNPRLSYFLRDGMTRMQIDVNLLKPLVLAQRAKFAPYMGLGVALESLSFDSPGADGETSFGFNYVFGGTMNVSGGVKPFAQFQYTVLNEAPNNAVLSVGLHVLLGGSAGR